MAAIIEVADSGGVVEEDVVEDAEDRGDPGHLRSQCPKLVRPQRFANSVIKPEGHTIVVTDEELALFNQLKVSSSPPPTNHDSVSSQSATFVQTGNPVACVSSSSSRKWVIDSGASDHMSGSVDEGDYW
ncbi:uncharacterized protein LOC116010795 [Ipomoea triloba]|uniref:uncharacterized protein LOC116010795 n=1 Tax=Ipomoea triloba TaxID=35885 RepID=UPI00125E8C77|nr:uncharacterized protein LOC116010795 [Ipomoea triloba]